MSLDPYSDEDLRSYVRSYDEHFTHAAIPTDRLKDVYMEAVRLHGPHLLRVDDYLRAWDRLQSKGDAPRDLRPMGARGADCSICKGTGRTLVYLPLEQIEVEKECPYHCDVVTALTLV